MGINVLSLFDGMSCGQLALKKAGVEVENYVASEVKPFAINHTKAKFPDTIDAGDVTKLHYEGGKLYRDCKRWCIGDPSVLSRDDLEKNKENIKTTTIGGQDFVLVNVVDLEFGKGFDEKNKILADYKDNGLVLNASTLSEDELNVYRDLGFVDLPNGEIAIWEFDESNKIFEGTFDILIGGSPCFTAETPVLTKDGYKPIVDVKVGDEVVVHNKYYKVLNFFDNGMQEVFDLTFDDGYKVSCTYNHKFLVYPNNWKEAKDLTTQDKIVTDNENVFRTIKIKDNHRYENVYDIEVDIVHYFQIGSGIIVHNCQNFSLASSTNDEKYGLEGPKSRLFFDYIRLRSETSPRYYFLENVNMKNDSKEMLDGFLGNEGVLINSEAFTIQHRPRVYWTNIPTDGKIVSDKTEDEINFQNFKLRTLPRLEWALYVKKFPGSYFGYDDNAIETIKGGFVFDDELTDDTNRLVNRRTKVVEAIEGTKRDIREIVNFDENNNPDVSFTDEEAFEIARMNEWARSEVEAFVGEPISDRKFVDFVHNQMLEAMVKKSPSRDGMRYGKHQTDADGKDKFVGQCHNITNAPRIQCLTRKQDRFPNSGLITFGPYCRFVTKLEICKGQTVPYEFLGDLKYGEVQDVCGDGWTVDVVAKFFEKLATNEDTLVENNAELHIEETTIEKESESMMLNDANVGEDTVKDASETSLKEMAATKQDNAEKEVKLAGIPKGKVDSALVFESIRKHCDEKTYSKILYDVVGWKAIKKMSKDDVDEEIVEIIREEIREAIKGRALSSSKEIEEKFEWLI